MWRSTTAACGCGWWEHLAHGHGAALHDGGVCVHGLACASLDIGLARALDVHVPDRASHVDLTPADKRTDADLFWRPHPWEAYVGGTSVPDGEPVATLAHADAVRELRAAVAGARR
ncbi:hypothetical protein [Tsukamurella soli]|uniref:Uncharacterized protein n=2 Tax=Tsukamurella soli TaxID=644556 RepID=A0ABP8KII5_9ACTN